MSLKHIGIVKNGKDQPADNKTKNWSGAMETYLLSETKSITELKVTVDMVSKYEQYFSYKKFQKPWIDCEYWSKYGRQLTTTGKLTTQNLKVTHEKSRSLIRNGF